MKLSISILDNPFLKNTHKSYIIYDSWVFPFILLLEYLLPHKIFHQIHL